MQHACRQKEEMIACNNHNMRNPISLHLKGVTHVMIVACYHPLPLSACMTKTGYSLMIQPMELLIEKCFRLMRANLLTDKEMKGNLMEQFNSQHFGVGIKLSRKDLGSAVVRLATKRTYW